MIDPGALPRALRRFALTMVDGYDPLRALAELSGSVVEVMDASAAGVALVEGNGLRFVTGSDELAERAEHTQMRLKQGPGLESLNENRPVMAADLGDCHRCWPGYAPAVEEIGFQAVVGIPLSLGNRRIGSLGIYNTRPRWWTDDDVGAGSALADIAAAFLINAQERAECERTTEQLQTALNSRVVIEQAKGILVGRSGISLDDAFASIRSSARRERSKVAVIAQRIVDKDDVPTEPAAVQRHPTRFDTA